MNSRPQITEKEAREILKVNKVTDKVCLIGIRGYYQDSIGKRGANDRNVYDDAILIISDRHFYAFRANTDPSVYEKGIATMTTGVHRYYKGKHKNRYWALRLVGERVSVTRDGQKGLSVGEALNIHKGGIRTTGSRGCQTLAPADWDDFIEFTYDEMAFFGQRTIPYVLIDEKDRRRGAFKMPLLAEKEIDNLLIRFDESDKNEPAARIDTQTEKPASKPIPVPSAPPSVSQSQMAGASPAQPVQSIIEENLSLPSLGGYITETVARAEDTVSQTVETRETILEKAEKYGDVIQSVSERVERIQSSFAPISNASWTITLFSKILGFALFVWAFFKDNWQELLIAVFLIGIGAYIYSRAKDRAVAKQTAVVR